MAVGSRERIVIVGGGPAAAASAVALREAGHEGELVMISDEDRAPYSRPPLSKAFLRGEVSAADLALGIADAELRTGTRARRVDFEERSVTLDDGECLPYGGLVLATGLRARRPATDVEVLETLADAERISARLRTVGSVTVVGSGFLAYELASAARAVGAQTALVIRPGTLEARFGLMESVLANRAVAAGVRVVHSSGGEFECGSGAGRVSTVEGERLEADLVLAAIGSEFEGDLTPGPVAGGFIVDRHCRLRDTVVVAGDAALRRTARGLRRDATWTNALAQATAAARSLLDDHALPYAPTPYAWTEAFGLEVKVAGRPPLGVRVSVIDGDLDEHRALLQWTGGAASIGYRIPAARLKALAMPKPATLDS